MDNTNGYCMAHLQIRHRRNTDIKYTTWLIYRYIVIVTNIKLTSWHIYGYIIILTWTSSTQCGSSMGDVINVRQTSNSTPLKIFQGWRGVENVERDVIKSSPSIIFSVCERIGTYVWRSEDTSAAVLRECYQLVF